MYLEPSQISDGKLLEKELVAESRYLFVQKAPF